ncbi:MAG TPA: hypothetical protein VLI67_01765 [Vicinamibacteria bacterium]|nr:hypothetical protein [Vicinamibacteria bacterium]
MRALAIAASLNVALHVLGLALALGHLRPGTPLVPLGSRLGYLAARPLGWSIGWAVWMLCALALVAFLAAVARDAPNRARAALAVTVAIAGAAVDLLCDTLQIVVLPQLAARAAADATLFLAAERGLGAGGTVVANGLYSIAVLLMTLALPGRLPALGTVLGVATFLAGLGMVGAGFTGDPGQLEAATGATLGAFIAWTVAVTWSLRRRTE